MKVIFKSIYNKKIFCWLDVFLSTEQVQSVSMTSFKLTDGSFLQEEEAPIISSSQPLPQGWLQKIDQKTGKAYFEK